MSNDEHYMLVKLGEHMLVNILHSHTHSDDDH